jgi:type IV pilus assembly protein PilC
MVKYRYIARDRIGVKSRGKVSALTKREAMTALREKGFRVIELTEIPETIWNKDLSFGSPVKQRDFVLFLRQFATLLRAGVTIIDSIQILHEQADHKGLKVMLALIEEDLRTGQSLSFAINKHPKVFSPLYINMIKAGEAGGNIDDVLERLADYAEKQYHLKQKVWSTLAYPITVGIVAILITAFLLTFVVPTFVELFKDFNSEIPAITLFVLGLSDWMKQYWYIVILLVAGITISLSVLSKREPAKYYFDYVKLKTPIFGKLFQKVALARMARTLSSLFTSSVPILQALSIVENVIGNDVMTEVVKKSRDALESGRSITEPMKKHWAFPPLVTQMITIGEQTGALDAMLAKVADFYEKEVETSTDKIKSLIEPMMIIVLAFIVGTIVLAIMIPMFEIFNNINTN